MSKPSALVLLSGGMDSTTLLYYVLKKLKYTKVECVGFNYEQRHKKEIKYAKKICENLSLPFNVIEVNLRQFGNSALTDKIDVPVAEEDKQYLTVVPGRNSIFLSLVSAYASIRGLSDVFIGVNLDDFRTYNDCREDYIHHINIALTKGCGIRGVYAPFVNMSKVDIVKLGLELDVPYELTWTCYLGEEEPCMKCDACIERLEAFKYFGRDYYGREKV